MRQLRPLTRPALGLGLQKPAGRPPKLDFLPLSLLRIDDSYQRALEPRGLRNIGMIHDHFDWARFAPLVVARVAGTDLYTIIDGQHRATAALLRGFAKVPCCIVAASAIEQAGIFTAVNGSVTPITIFQLFKAARISGAQWALDIDAACKPAGLKPLLYPKPKSAIKPFETMAIGTLRQNIGRFGVDEVGAALVQAARQAGAAEPGFWSSGAINHAVADWRLSSGKRQETTSQHEVSMAQRIRDLKQRGYSRFAIQASIGCKLADIEEALGGAR